MQDLQSNVHHCVIYSAARAAADLVTVCLVGMDMDNVVGHITVGPSRPVWSLVQARRMCVLLDLEKCTDWTWTANTLDERFTGQKLD